jgi:hypothetical protein
MAKKNASPAKSDPVVSRADIEAQKARQRKWLAEGEASLRARRQETAANESSSSDRALKVVLFLWLLIVIGIFWHVYNSIQNSNNRSGAHDEL